MSPAKSSEITKSDSSRSFLKFQYLRVEIDDQGNLLQIIKLNKNMTLSFTSQGFYWYEGMLIIDI
jgi:hypothetical protein